MKRTNNLTFNVDVDLLYRSGISINEFLFLHLIKNNQKDLFTEYHSLFPNLITRGGIDNLVEKGFLKFKDPEGKYLFDNFQITEDFINLLEIRGDQAIEDLKRAYPRKTPSGSRVGLHNDGARWQAKYLSIIKKDRALHEKILKCIEAEKIHRQKTRSEEFWAQLTTYVNNKRWEAYLEQIDNLNLAPVQYVEDI